MLKRGSRNIVRLILVLSLLGLCGLAVWAASPKGNVNGFAPSGQAQTLVSAIPITIDAGWSCTEAVPPTFTWGAGQPVFANNGPFIFTAPGSVVVRVTDSFCAGDQFRIYDWGSPIGECSTPTSTECFEICDPNVAYTMPEYSHGDFPLGPGPHSITIEVISNPFGGGAAFIRVDSSVNLSTSFYDDKGRSQFCVDVASGAYQWNILKGNGSISFYTGTLNVLNGGTLFTSFPGDPNQIYLVYDVLHHKANGYMYTMQILGVTSVAPIYSPLKDRNTNNDPPCDTNPIPEDVVQK